MASSSSPIPNANNNNSNNNNSNQFRDERVIFLKELARNADIDIYDLANQLSLSQESVMAYIRSFFKTVAEFVNSDDQLDKNGYGNVKRVINSNVSTEHGGLTDNHVQNLMYVYEKYRKLQPDLYIEADGVKANRLYSLPKQVSSSSSTQQPEMIAHSTGNSPSRNNNDVDEEFRHIGPQDFEHNVDRLNKPHNYEFLGKLTRKGLVQWVLEGVPIPISTPKVENYIQYFEVNQDEIFISPSMLRSSLIDWFGDKTGDNAAKLIYSYLKFLPSSEGFGQQKLSGGKFKEGYFSGDNPLYQRPGIAHYPGSGPSSGNPFAPSDGYSGSGPRMEDPYNTYYHAQGILPFGMNIYSQDARRLINEAEQKRKRREEQKEEQQEMMDMMRNKMSMSYAEMFDAKKFGFAGGNGNGQGSQIFTPEFLQGLIATQAITGVTQGKMQALPYKDPETGRMEVKLVPAATDPNAALAAAAPPELGLKDMLELVKTMYETVDRKRDEAMSFKIDTLKEVYGNKEGDKDGIAKLGETMEALKKIIPGLDTKFSVGGNGHDLDLHRLLLEKDKFMYDREKTDKIIEHQLSVKDRKEEFEHENELAANKSRNQSLKMISNILASNLPMFIQLIMTFLSMRNPKFAPFASMLGGGGGGMMGGGGGQSGGMGGGMGGIGDLIGNLLKGVSGGGEEEEEEEDDDNAFMQTKKKRHKMMDEEDEGEDEEGEGGFNLGGLQGMVGQAMDLLKSAGMPGLDPAAAANANEEEDSGGVVIPETRHQQHRHSQQQQHRHNRGGGGTRPTFRNVSIGNPNAQVVQMPVPGTEAVNAYDDIESESRKRMATTPNPTSPTVEDIMRNSIGGAAAGVVGGPAQEYTNAYGDRIPGDMINEPPQVVIPETSVQEEEGEGEEEYDDDDDGGEQTKEEGYPEYRTEDFSDWTVEQLQNARKDGHDAAKSHQSYLKSVEEVLRQKEERS